MDKFTPVVQMLSFDPPPVVFPRGAEYKRLFSQSARRAAAHLGQKKKGSGGVWFIEPEADAQKREKERKRERGAARTLAAAKS